MTDRHDDATVETHFHDRLSAHRRAVDELAVGLLPDHVAADAGASRNAAATTIEAIFFMAR